MGTKWRKLGAALLLALPLGFWAFIIAQLYNYSRVQGWQAHFVPYARSYVLGFMIWGGLWQPTVLLLALAVVVYPWRGRPPEGPAGAATGEGVWPPPPSR